MTTAAVRLRNAKNSWHAIGAPFRRNRWLRVASVAVIIGLVVIFPLFFSETSDKVDTGTTALPTSYGARAQHRGRLRRLLDLGYVAFYALGALTMGWLGSSFAYQIHHGKGIHIGVASSVSHIPGST
jgi:hypothetical protein